MNAIDLTFTPYPYRIPSDPHSILLRAYLRYKTLKSLQSQTKSFVYSPEHLRGSVLIGTNTWTGRKAKISFHKV